MIYYTLGKSVKFAEKGTQYPSVCQIVNRAHPITRNRHQQVGHGQIDDVEIGGGPQPFVVSHHQNHQEVPHQGHGTGHCTRHDLNQGLHKGHGLLLLRVGKL